MVIFKPILSKRLVFRNVCYANDPKKGGYMTPAPALDLTTSLRGDFPYPAGATPDTYYVPLQCPLRVNLERRT